DLLVSCQKSASSGKSAVLPLLTNQSFAFPIWQAIHGLPGIAEIVSDSLMPAYRVANKAHDDLISIGRFTVKQWGMAQRNFYLQQLDDCFSRIAGNPELGMACDFIADRYRKFPHGSHIIFYKQGADGVIEIIRVLHKSMDIESKF
ncbi:MAG: type II toxin-antitoxin system RelE/ParE family toxin, partial [Mariprofundaceae bacterium]|nr:type II toxin-antitoxin system RelE/ParE family toxin [Mariprofundaceae bacterium]